MNFQKNKLNNRPAGISRWSLRKNRYILTAGELTKREGIHYLVEAFKQLEDAAKTPNNFKLVIVAAGSGDADYVKYLHTISEGRDNIVLVHDKYGRAAKELFSNAYLYVHPAESHGALDLLEQAMRCGLAPVVSDIGESIALVGTAGFVFPVKSVKDLRDRLAYLLNRTEEVKSAGLLAKKQMGKRDAEIEKKRKLQLDAEQTLIDKHKKLSWMWKHVLRKNH